MSKLRVIGDVHGKFMRYVSIIDQLDTDSVQIGDFGLGFAGCKLTDDFITEYLQKEGNMEHRFIRGNHDNPQTCYDTPEFIPDGTVKDNIMFIGGAWSIDSSLRTEGLDWWADEEVSTKEWYIFLDMYAISKPEIMITHDCPQFFSTKYIVDEGLAMGNVAYKTVTGQALEVCFDMHKPKLWIFGHWHHTLDVTVDGTRFICLNELDYCDIDTETFDVKFRDKWRNET